MRYAATAGRVAVLPAKPVPWPVCNETRFSIDLAHLKVSCDKQRPFVKTGSPQVLLGGPGGQGTRVEVSPDTSRA